MTPAPRRHTAAKGNDPAEPPRREAHAGSRVADELDTIAMTRSNVRDVADWLVRRGYRVRRLRSPAKVLSAFHPDYLERHAVQPGDVLICDRSTGRIWKG